MKIRKRVTGSRRGIYLISTLLLLTFLVIVGGAVMVSFQQGIASSGNFNNRQMAQQAALAGLQYIQARMESNVTNYSPAGAAGPALLTTGDGSFQVKESGFNVCGFMTNSNVAGSNEGRVFMMFRACFNNQYASLSAQPESWGFCSFDGTTYSMPTMAYISVNNLNRTPSQNAYSYNSEGGTLQTVPGGFADIVVEGMAVSPGGKVLASRVVESMVNISQIGSISGAASAAGDMQLTVAQAGGKVSVSAADPTSNYAADAGLAALNNIYLYGADALSGGTMPDYESGALASLKDSNKKFYYVNNGTKTDFTADVAQEKVVQPPGLPQSSLAAPTNPTTVKAGTWVIWNGALYHYATEYQGFDGNGDPIALNSQPWAQSGNSPPTYNGVSTDTPSGQPTLDTGGKLVLDTTSNTITVNQDASVAANGSNQAFSVVVAPSSYQKSDGTTATINSPQFDSAAVGSAQMVFDASTGSTPQFRSGGSITIMGNVTGQGSLVSLGRSSTNQTIAGDINVVGKSSIDTRSDSGIALYAAGSLNLLQLSTVQAPSSVPAVNTSLVGSGITPGSGGASTTVKSGFTSQEEAVSSALSQALKTLIDKGKAVVSYNRSTGSYTVAYGSNASLAEDMIIYNGGGSDIKVTYNGTDYKGSLAKVLGQLIPSKSSELTKTEIVWIGGKKVPWPADSAIEGVKKLTTGTDQLVSGLDPLFQDSSFTTTSYRFYKTTSFTSKTLQNYISYGSATASATPTPTPTPVANASPTPAPSPTPGGTVVQGALDQSFTGLVYAGKNVNMKNQLGDISLSGALVAYGADPSAGSPGTSGGNISITANNVKIQYDPTLLGPYAQFLGGRVTLKKTCLSVY